MNAANSGIGMTSQRTRMRMVERLRGQGVRDELILAAMGEVPRHIFVDEALASRAYEDMSLPLGFGQTISSPYTVARMLELLRSGSVLDKVLEIGTGCGYQAAVLSRLAREVYSVERLAPLLTKARRHLRDARAHNVRVRNADGNMGSGDRYFLSFGIETPYSLLPKTGSATYSGIARGTGWVPQLAYSGDVSGTSQLSVDFALAQLTMTLNLSADDPGNSVIGSYAMNGNIAANGFYGNVFRGNFYGPNANEFGAVWHLTAPPGQMNLSGVAAGKKN